MLRELDHDLALRHWSRIGDHGDDLARQPLPLSRVAAAPDVAHYVGEQTVLIAERPPVAMVANQHRTDVPAGLRVQPSRNIELQVGRVKFRSVRRHWTHPLTLKSVTTAPRGIAPLVTTLTVHGTNCTRAAALG